MPVHCLHPVVAVPVHCLHPVVAVPVHCLHPVVAVPVHCLHPVVAVPVHCLHPVRFEYAVTTQHEAHKTVPFHCTISSTHRNFLHRESIRLSTLFLNNPQFFYLGVFHPVVLGKLLQFGRSKLCHRSCNFIALYTRQFYKLWTTCFGLLCPPSSGHLDITNSMELVNKFSAFFLHKNVVYRVHKIPPLVPLLTQMNSIHAFPTYFPEIHFNNILRLHGRFFHQVPLPKPFMYLSYKNI